MIQSPIRTMQMLLNDNIKYKMEVNKLGHNLLIHSFVISRVFHPSEATLGRSKTSQQGQTLSQEYCTLNNAHYTLNTKYYIIHTANCTLHTRYSTPHTEYYPLKTTYCTQHIVHYILHNHCSFKGWWL